VEQKGGVPAAWQDLIVGSILSVQCTPPSVTILPHQMFLSSCCCCTNVAATSASRPHDIRRRGRPFLDPEANLRASSHSNNSVPPIGGNPPPECSSPRSCRYLSDCHLVESLASSCRFKVQSAACVDVVAHCSPVSLHVLLRDVIVYLGCNDDGSGTFPPCPHR